MSSDNIQDDEAPQAVPAESPASHPAIDVTEATPTTTKPAVDLAAAAAAAASSSSAPAAAAAAPVHPPQPQQLLEVPPGDVGTPGLLHSSTSANLRAAMSDASSSSFDDHHNQRIRGRKPGFIATDQGDVPVSEYFNQKHGLRTVEPIKETLTFFQAWVLTPILYAIMWLLANVFFREVDVIGKENIPKDGPVVFAASHTNQFMDSLLLLAHAGRPVKFIIAEKSMSRPVIGQFARLLGAVPVVRPQDAPSTIGKGKIIKIQGASVAGSPEARFKTDVCAGDVISWSVVSMSASDSAGCVAQVKSVESDTELTLTQPVEASHEVGGDKATPYKVSRRIDHSDMYSRVYHELEQGGTIGIFPEGGSHDRTSLLPLKAGVALFSLGAAERGINPVIIPVGLTYFYGHKFRSRAHIEFGKPIHPPPDLVAKFSTDKRTTTGNFLKSIETALRDVTINCEDWNTLKFVHSFRRLYQDPGIRLETIDYLRLTRRLARIAQDRSTDPDFAEFRSRVENYLDFCNALFVRDAQAATLGNLKQNVSVMLLFRRVVVLAILFFTLVPFFVIAGPVGIVSHLASEAHARTALSASSVKVVGADVKASYKIICGFTLFPLMCCLVSGMVYWKTDGDARTAATVFLCVPMAMYVSLFLVHEFILELYAALPLFISLVSNHKQFMKLYERRMRLVQSAHNIVKKFDPQLQREMAVYDGASSPTAPAPSFFSLRHRSHTHNN